MSNIHIIDNKSEGSYSITLTIYESGNQKLSLVKIIKSITDYGLKDSKDIVDSIPYVPQIIKVWKTRGEIVDIKDKLSNCNGCKYEMTDIQSLRNTKLIELGICDKSDLVDELVGRDIEKILHKFNYSSIVEVLYDRYSKISEDNLKVILNESNI